MYTRSFGDPAPEMPAGAFGPTVVSDGQLYNMQNQPPPPPPSPAPGSPPAGAGLLNRFRGTLGRLETDDLILAAIGVLILLDGSESNDILVLFILALLFF